MKSNYKITFDSAAIEQIKKLPIDKVGIFMQQLIDNLDAGHYMPTNNFDVDTLLQEQFKKHMRRQKVNTYAKRSQQKNKTINLIKNDIQVIDNQTKTENEAQTINLITNNTQIIEMQEKIENLDKTINLIIPTINLIKNAMQVVDNKEKIENETGQTIKLSSETINLIKNDAQVIDTQENFDKNNETINLSKPTINLIVSSSQTVDTQDKNEGDDVKFHTCTSTTSTYCTTSTTSTTSTIVLDDNNDLDNINISYSCANLTQDVQPSGTDTVDKNDIAKLKLPLVQESNTVTNTVPTVPTDNSNNSVSTTKKTRKPRVREPFKAPTPDEVDAYIEILKNKKNCTIDFDGSIFCNYYERIGWVVGKAKTPMKDWHSAVNYWIVSDKKRKEDEAKAKNKNVPLCHQFGIENSSADYMKKFVNF